MTGLTARRVERSTDMDEEMRRRVVEELISEGESPDEAEIISPGSYGHKVAFRLVARDVGRAWAEMFWPLAAHLSRAIDEFKRALKR